MRDRAKCQMVQFLEHKTGGCTMRQLGGFLHRQARVVPVPQTAKGPAVEGMLRGTRRGLEAQLREGFTRQGRAAGLGVMPDLTPSGMKTEVGGSLPRFLKPISAARGGLPLDIECGHCSAIRARA